MDVVFQGIDIAELERVLAAGVDHGGHPVQPFVDTEGGWPLRCCLADSAPGDGVAIIAWTQLDVLGPYRETGPIVVHTNGCTGAPPLPELPAGLDRRPMMLRPYDAEHRIVYSSVVAVEEGDSNSAVAARLLEDPAVEFVHGRNWRGGCWAFAAHARRRHDEA